MTKTSFLDSTQALPLTKERIGQQGTTYDQHFCTIAICCPSRVSLLTGKMAHNTNVTDVACQERNKVGGASEALRQAPWLGAKHVLRSLVIYVFYRIQGFEGIRGQFEYQSSYLKRFE